MPRDYERDRLTDEWREHVINRLDEQHREVGKLQESIVQLMLNTSTNKSLGELEMRVRELEKFQVRVVAAVIVAQLFLGITWQLLSKFVFK